MKSQKTWFCSDACLRAYRKTGQSMACQYCGDEFVPDKKGRKYCSHSCSNRARRGITFSFSSRGNKNRRRLMLLKNTFDFTDCMIEGCGYRRVFNVHRFIPGSDGGEYVIGNMFAICPNHHSEIHSNLVRVEKVNDHVLRVVEDLWTPDHLA